MKFFSKKPEPGTVRALFLHIQKTAGTSIVHVARQFYADSITTHGECWSRKPKELKAIRFVSGHIGYQFAQPLLHDRYSFTFLRDPVERILSMYYFCRSRDPGEFMIYRRAHELELCDFLRAGFSDPWVKKNIWNNQVWQLAHGYAHTDQRTINDFLDAELLDLARQHLEQFSYVGFTEKFAADAQAVLSALALPAQTRTPELNATTQRPCAQDVPGEAQQLLGELTVLDRELYAYAQARRGGALAEVAQ
jgi:hypothetical protein